LYLDSEFAPAGNDGRPFGDGDLLPRLQRWRDVFDGLEHATDPWQQQPAVFGALQSEYMTYAFLALSDAGTSWTASADALTPTPLWQRNSQFRTSVEPPC